MKLIKIAFMFLSMSTSMNMLAALEGVVDDTSTGTVSISMSVLPSIQIQDVDDIRLNITDRKSDTLFNQSFCVTGNKFGKYTVTAYSSDQDPDDFLLYNNINQALPYYVGYRGDPSRNKFDPLTPMQPSPVYDVTPFNEGCDKSASFQITFRSEDLMRVKSGLYTGHLTLTISPL